MKIGIIGYGYWGPNIVRNFEAQEGCKVVAIADLRPERLEEAGKRYPDAALTTNPYQLIHAPEIDALAIVSPVSTHYGFAKQALLNGKHVMVEKPMTTRTDRALELIRLAEKQGKVLMTDHTFLYTGAVEKMKELVGKGELGKLRYIDCTRINLGIFQQDVNVLWDLACHDLSVINHLVDEQPESVQAIGRSHTGNGIENIAYLILHYPSGLIAHITASWVSPVKVRSMLIGGDRKMIVFNDIEPTEKLKVYDKGYTITSVSDEDKRNVLVDYRVGDVHIPKIHIREALAGMAADFCNAVKQGTKPRSGSQSGLQVVRILELAGISMKNGGKAIPLNGGIENLP